MWGTSSSAAMRCGCKRARCRPQLSFASSSRVTTRGSAFYLCCASARAPILSAASASKCRRRLVSTRSFRQDATTWMHSAAPPHQPGPPAPSQTSTSGPLTRSASDLSTKCSGPRRKASMVTGTGTGTGTAQPKAAATPGGRRQRKAKVTNQSASAGRDASAG